MRIATRTAPRPVPPPDRTSWGPATPRVSAVRRDGPAMTALRVTTYVLTSVSCIVFLALVGYGAVQVTRMQDALEQWTSTLRAPVDTATPGSAQSQYLHACETGVLRAADCP